MNPLFRICPVVTLLFLGVAPAPRDPIDTQSAIVAVLLAAWDNGSVDSLLISPTPLPPGEDWVPSRTHPLDTSVHLIAGDFPGDYAFAQAWTAYSHPVLGEFQLDLPEIAAQLRHHVSLSADSPSATKGHESWVWVAFSKAGFSRDSSVSVIYRVYYCGRECAGSDTFVLQRQAGQWAVDRAYQGWRS
jgi:hypothetical protein